MVVTFYSYKGGVGRSMALANIAEILADRQLDVTVCDWDLEAPGLERYFADADRAKSMQNWPGIMDLLLEYQDHVRKPPAREEGLSSGSEDFKSVGRLRLRRPSSYAREVRPGRRIRLLSAGRRDGEYNRKYSEAVRSFDWTDFYRSWAGGSYLDFFREELVGDRSIVLIDSRTGVTEQGGVCTHHLADLVVNMSAPNDLNLEGARWMFESLGRSDLRITRGNRDIGVLPLAARVEQMSEKGFLAEFRRNFRLEFAGKVPPQIHEPAKYLEKSEIPYVPFYAFRERVSAREPEGERHPAFYAAYERVADAILEWGAATRLLAPSQTSSAVSPDRPPQYFLSHSGAASAAARELTARCQAAGARVWLDDERLVKSPWFDDLARGLAESAVFILFVDDSPDPVPSDIELRSALFREAVDPAFRIVVILGFGASSSAIPPHLRAFPCLAWIDLASEPAALRLQFAEVTRTKPARPMNTENAEAQSPFRGLLPFHEENALMFFGRDAEIVELLDSLSRGPLLTVVGSSSAGKTSLVLAGLMPALKRGRFFDGASWVPSWKVAAFEVSARPIEDLTETLAQFGPGFPEDAGGSHRLLVVDRLERLLLAEADSTERDSTGGVPKAFLEKVIALSGLPQMHVVVIVRTDGLARLSSFPQNIRDRLWENVYAVRGVKPENLAGIVEKPLRLSGIGAEPGLIDAIVGDLGNVAETLSLLEFLLQQLYENRTNSLLTLQSYVDLGRFTGVLRNHAESTFAQFTEDQRKLARRILLRLVQPGEGSEDRRRIAAKSEILGIGAQPAECEQILAALSSRGIVVVRALQAGHPRESDAEVEIAHPMLIRDWPSLREWISASRDSLKTELRIVEDARKWMESGRPARLLYRGARLSEAVEWIKENSSNLRSFEMEFLRASRFRRTVRILEVWGGAAVVLAILIVLSLFPLRDPIFSSLVALRWLSPRPADTYTATFDNAAILRDWKIPPGWQIVEPHDADSAPALVVVGNQIGAYMTGYQRAFYDFGARFPVKFVAGAELAWVLRVQPNLKRGYIFRLRLDGAPGAASGTLALSAAAYPDNTPLGPDQRFQFPMCCKPGDAFLVDTHAADFDFRQNITFVPADLSNPSAGLVWNLQTFSDARGLYRWGGLGFLEPDSGSKMGVGYLVVQHEGLR